MPRNPDGTYPQPVADVAANELVASAWGNTLNQDHTQEIENSLSRDGLGGMRAQVKGNNSSPNNTPSLPSYGWNGETNSGMYLAAAGDVRFSLLGVDSFRLYQGNAQVFQAGSWQNLVTSVSGVTVDAADVTFNGTVSVISGSDVEAALESTDAVLASHNTHIADTNIHWTDVPNNGVTYNRRNGVWVESIAGVSDHSALNGLTTGDDHTQYYNQTRGDARYLQLTGKAANSTQWDDYNLVVTANPGSDPDTIYMVPE